MWSSWVQGNSNGPLVPMVRLVPMEKHPIPMVLLVNMHLITDTIRQTDGPLVPMVRLVPIEKHPIPMVLSVHMHLIKGT